MQVSGGYIKMLGVSGQIYLQQINILLICLQQAAITSLQSARAEDRKIYHYNGTDWKEIEQLTSPKADYWAVWTDGKEAFVVGHINDGSSRRQ